MEFFEYLRHMYRYKIWLLIGAILGGVIAGGVVATMDDQYRAVMSLYTKRQADPSTPQYFTYEGYYAQQTAANYTETAIKLLTNEEIIGRAAESAGLAKDPDAIDNLRSSLTIKKEAPQLIKLTVHMGNANDVSTFTKGLAEALKERTVELNQSGDTLLAVDAVNPEPDVVLARPSWLLFGLVGALSGLLLATIISAVWSHIQVHRRRR